MRKHLKFFLLASLAALALRSLFVLKFPAITSDSSLYSDIATNWLRHSAYALTDGPKIVPTDIRLPGYPAFLAVIFSVFGLDQYRIVLFLQVLIDLGTCFLTADMARRLISDRAAKIAFLLTALCPFLANYSGAVLTETLEIFFTALALDFAVIGLQSLQAELENPAVFENNRRQSGSFSLWPWLSCGLAIGAAIFLRPDGGLLLIALELYFAWIFLRRIRSQAEIWRVLRAAAITGTLALLPLVPWTLRNLHTLHEFQPLAPRYANNQADFFPAGFNLWVKTWIADYTSVEEVYWNVPGDAIEIQQLPTRAFDSPAQRQQTEEILRDYNLTKTVSPQLDAQFFALARQRIRDNPLRYYIWLPALRIADMWLRPRTELLPSDTRWWEFNDDPIWSAVAVFLGLVNLAYLCAAFFAFLRTRLTGALTLLLLFCLLRSVFLGTLENPEPRYTLEMYPVVIVFLSWFFVRHSLRARMRGTAEENIPVSAIEK